MRIGIIVPDRGDRPRFSNQFNRLLLNQSIFPKHKEIKGNYLHRDYTEIKCDNNTILVAYINYQPESDACDITQRYRRGYDILRNKDLEVIFLMENDDYYAVDYIENMYDLWVKNNKPDLFGLNHTIYYHIGLRKYYTMHHTVRSSTMNTLIKPDLNFPWPTDNVAYIDIHLWECQKIKNKIIVEPPKNLCLGIKHGVGKCGGGMHVSDLHRYTKPGSGNDDEHLIFLQINTDPESFKFYKSFREWGDFTELGINPLTS